MFGTLEQTDDGPSRLRFVRILPHPPERVWRAITEPDELIHWFPTTIEGERAAGAALRFSFPEGRARRRRVARLPRRPGAQPAGWRCGFGRVEGAPGPLRRGVRT